MPMLAWIILTLAAALGGYMFWLVSRNPAAAPSTDEAEALLAGEISNWPSKEELEALLREAGFATKGGAFSIRMAGFDSFVFRTPGGGAAPPAITASHESVDELNRFAGQISAALAQNAIRHRFEIYDSGNRLAGAFSHDWPDGAAD
jgi:hypothetical protein